MIDKALIDKIIDETDSDGNLWRIVYLKNGRIAEKLLVQASEKYLAKIENERLSGEERERTAKNLQIATIDAIKDIESLKTFLKKEKGLI